MKRTWTQVGKEIVGVELESYDSDTQQILTQAHVEQAINNIEWQKIPENGTLQAPAMPGMGIKEVVKQCNVPKVSHVAWSNTLAPYGFYGIRGHYKDGMAEIFVVDLGTHLTPVCSDFYPKEVPA